ncbi:MAG: hypothetical protein LBE08_00045 [Bifidobacteriaceae bacterium]|jgi:protein-L-isoaspartate O-methyltransferase|nr:hypothetical protein [Bifidobacteriaceae bacterium]
MALARHFGHLLDQLGVGGFMVVVVGSDQRIRLAWERTLASRVRTEVLATCSHPVAGDFQKAAENYASLFERAV